MPNDKASDYYNFTHPNKWIESESFKHRLGKFKTSGSQRVKTPKVVILHILDFDRFDGQVDHTSDLMAEYLSNPPEAPTTVKENGCCNWSPAVHAIADRQKYIKTMPGDSVIAGCANPNTAMESIEIEIAGTFKDHATPEYWKSEDAKLKLTQAAKALIDICRLSDIAMPPLQEAHLSVMGQVVIPGFCQHRDVPMWAQGQWRQPPESFKFGQHEDICLNFPYEILFDIIKKEIDLEVNGKLNDIAKNQNNGV